MEMKLSDGNDETQNPIVAMAMKIRARRDLGAAIDSATSGAVPAGVAGDDDEARFAALGEVLATGAKRLNSILGRKEKGVTFIRLERPVRLRLRFRDQRISLDFDRERQLVIVAGGGLDGEYQFDSAAPVPALINLSKLSTEAGYGDALTGSSILKQIAADAELPRPAHLDATGPLQL
jgi:hypothetical protein